MQEGNPVDRDRRRLSAGLCLSFLAGALPACGGAEYFDETAQPASSGSSSQWEVASTRSVELSPGGTFDLAATLPSGVARGGAFSIDPSGAPLPSGIRLDRTGLLSADRASIGVSAAGVVFRYSPPA